MKIRFLGVGAAFTTPAYYQSNMLITAPSGRHLLLDCGADARFSLSEQLGAIGADLAPETCHRLVDAVFISHLHSDHIGGLEWLAFSTYYDPQCPTPRMFGEARMLRELWSQSLRGGLYYNTGRTMSLDDYFRLEPQADNARFIWEGLELRMVKARHIRCNDEGMFSHGLVARAADGSGRAAWISTDALCDPALIAAMADEVDLIFHDSETAAAPTGVHAHYQQLRDLPAAVKAKMWLYHYQPEPAQRPEQDGFLGFVRKGQVFEL